MQKIIHKMTTDNTELASAQQQRMRETMKLTESRLRNIEDTLKRLNAQRNNLSRYHDLFSALQEHSDHLYELNKEFSTMSREANDLKLSRVSWFRSCACRC